MATSIKRNDDDARGKGRLSGLPNCLVDSSQQGGSFPVSEQMLMNSILGAWDGSARQLAEHDVSILGGFKRGERLASPEALGIVIIVLNCHLYRKGLPRHNPGWRINHEKPQVPAALGGVVSAGAKRWQEEQGQERTASDQHGYGSSMFDCWLTNPA